LKFLLNMNLSRELGRLLEAQGHTWRHTRDAGLAEAADSEIVAIAKAGGEVILTHDLDYGNLLAFSGDHHPSVVIFRRRNVLPLALFTALMKVWEELEPALESGALVLIEDASVRIRRLPIGNA
jgi:predicted nuclease of predicted toxin-antitoxin system